MRGRSRKSSGTAQQTLWFGFSEHNGFTGTLTGKRKSNSDAILPTATDEVLHLEMKHGEKAEVLKVLRSQKRERCTQQSHWNWPGAVSALGSDV